MGQEPSPPEETVAQNKINISGTPYSHAQGPDISVIYQAKTHQTRVGDISPRYHGADISHAEWSPFRVIHRLKSYPQATPSPSGRASGRLAVWPSVWPCSRCLYMAENNLEIPSHSACILSHGGYMLKVSAIPPNIRKAKK